MKDLEARAKNVEEVFKAIVKLLSSRQHQFAKEIVENVKADEEFFDEFMNFLKRSYERRVVLLSALKRTIIEASDKIYS